MTTGFFSEVLPVPHSGLTDDVSIEAWEKAWSGVLERHVDAIGRVDFTGLAEDRAGLDGVAKFIAAIDPVASPGRFSTPNARLAYYLNAYNALAMHGVLAAGVPKRFGWLDRLLFFYFRSFRMGGRRISLYALENSIIRPLGDPRVHFALNCMSVGCPRLPQTAFTGERLDGELDAAAREFVEATRNVSIDRERREVILSAIFKFYTKDFLAQSSSLMTYVNHYRSEQIPAGYTVAFMDYDWTINRQPRRDRPQPRR